MCDNEESTFDHLYYTRKRVFLHWNDLKIKQQSKNWNL
jgi:hypothetical protein